jgi:hypothetical protein
MRNFETKFVEKMKKHILCLNFFVSQKSCRVRDNVEKYGRAGEATNGSIQRSMRFACWITKATDTHSEYVIFVASPRQKYLRKGVSMLRCPYIASFVCN